MSPHYLRTLLAEHRFRLVEYNRLHDGTGAAYPRDYWRPGDAGARFLIERKSA